MSRGNENAAPASLSCLVILLLLVANGGGSPNAGAAPSEFMRTTLQAMVLELVLPDRTDPDQPVRMTLRARNAGPETLVLGLTGRPVAFDLIVSRADGTEVWRRLHGFTVPLVMQLVRIGPGEVLEFSDDWSRLDNSGRRVPPGRYLVRGLLPIEDGVLASEPGELTIAATIRE
jgi:hypothetical protein